MRPRQTSVGEKRFPRPLTFLADQAIVEEFPLPGRGHPVGDEGEPAPRPIRGFDAQTDAIQHEVAVPIGEGTAVEGLHRAVERLGDGGDGGGTDRVAQHLREDRADLTSADPTQEDLADELIDLRHALLVAVDHGGVEAAVARAGDLEIGDRAVGGGQAAVVVAVAIPAAPGPADVAGRAQVVGEFIVHAIFQQVLHGAGGLVGNVAPQGRGVLDLAPQVA